MRTEPMTAEQMRVLELNAQHLGITLGMLMQQAGREVARAIEKRETVEQKRIVILCGTGGNGGDGMVAARHLHEAGANVEVGLIGSEKAFTSKDTELNWGILKNIDGIVKTTLLTESDVRSYNSAGQADVLVDAMLGFGQKSKVREPMLTAVKAFNASGARKYSIDVPTGVDSDSGQALGPAIIADVTITLHAPKTGLLLAKEFVGELVVARIGIPPEAAKMCGPGDLWLFNRPRPADSKKGDYGRVLVIGGSDVYSGAPALTGLAALRTGADLVRVLVPQAVVTPIRSYSPNLMVESLPTRVFDVTSVDMAVEAARGANVVSIGPGLGMAPETIRGVQDLLKRVLSLDMGVVVDADGLKALPGIGIKMDPSRCILTPHWGELQILLGQKSEPRPDIQERIRRAREAAAKYDSVILLKGPIDVIAHPDGRHKLNKTGVPAMTVGGTGDVLTGISSAMMARRRDAFEAAAAAAFVSGLAGEAAYQELGNHITATDCIAKIPVAMRG
ncbi:MAG: NAD(P)H-hydrate dehydratase [Candidatus Thorarchaeota archaeon]|nr:NAD(P)H-hydrate dehydratase [Candidatus Thorarchaeota archaeon]